MRSDIDALDLVMAVMTMEHLRECIALLEEDLAHPDETQARAVAVIAEHTSHPAVHQAPPEQRATIFSAALHEHVKDDPKLDDAVRQRMRSERTLARLKARLASIEETPDRFDA